jgi:hypothetical protein
MKVHKTLLASSATIKGLESMLNTYYYSTSYKIHDDLTVSNSKGVFDKVEVKHEKGRYKLYHV